MNFYIGKWDRYYHSQVIIIDGLTGETLWRIYISINFTNEKKNDKYQDSFLYQQRGQTTESVYSNSSWNWTSRWRNFEGNYYK